MPDYFCGSVWLRLCKENVRLCNVLLAAFRLTALLFLPIGLFLYFLPPSVATYAGISPLWMARIMGGMLLAWGMFLVAASQKPDGAKVGGLVGGNLLTVAALVPAIIKTGDAMPPAFRLALLAICGLLTVFAVMALLGYPEKPRLETKK